MAYLAELLVIMTDWLKIVRIHARNVYCIHGHQRLYDDASLVSHSRHVWQWPLSKKVVTTICPLHYDTKSEQSDCNKSSVR